LSTIRPSQFTLATIVLVMALVAVWLVLLRYWPLLGLVATFGFPALVRAVVLGRHRTLNGEPLSAGKYVELFVVSLYAVGLALLAAVVVFAPATLLTNAALATWGSAAEAARGDWAFVVGTIASLPVFLLAFWGLTFFPREVP
jgi:hypothetical protein